MSSLKAISYAALIAALIVPGVAYAADLALPPPAVVEPEPLPEPVVLGGNWYLRGHIGVSNQQVDELYNVLFDDPNLTAFAVEKKDFNSALFAGAGVGYRWNQWLRTDATAEYRFKSKFKGLDRYTNPTAVPPNGTNDYRASKSEILLMANAYVDMGTWYGFTPYLGAGVGTSRNTISGFTDTNVPAAGFATASDKSKWNFAWALYAGFGYDITERLTLDVAYRYLNLGDGITGDIVPSVGPNLVNNPMHFKDITSHDVMIGLRYALGSSGRATYAKGPDIQPLAPLEPLIVKN